MSLQLTHTMPAARSKSYQDAKKSKASLESASKKSASKKSTLKKSTSKKSPLKKSTTITTGYNQRLPALKQSTHEFNNLENCLQYVNGITPLHAVTIRQCPFSLIFHEVASLSTKAVAGANFHDDL
jgi:hypothetical protein